MPVTVGGDVAGPGSGDVDGAKHLAQPAHDDHDLPGLVDLDVAEMAGARPWARRDRVPEPLLGERAGNAVTGEPDPALERHHRLRGAVVVTAGRISGRQVAVVDEPLLKTV